MKGFDDDTIVRAALEGLAEMSDAEPRFEARIEKHIPVAAGLGGGSSDAAAALELANGLLDAPLDPVQLHRLAASLGADVPFFLQEGAQLATGDGTTLGRIELPRDYVVLLALPDGVTKRSTSDVYAAFDLRSGEHGFEDRRATLLAAIDESDETRAVSFRFRETTSPPRRSATSSYGLGAFRSDVTGRGAGRLRTVRHRARGRCRGGRRSPAAHAPGSRFPADTFVSWPARS